MRLDCLYSTLSRICWWICRSVIAVQPVLVDSKFKKALFTSSGEHSAGMRVWHLLMKTGSVVVWHELLKVCQSRWTSTYLSWQDSLDVTQLQSGNEQGTMVRRSNHINWWERCCLKCSALGTGLLDRAPEPEILIFDNWKINDCNVMDSDDLRNRSDTNKLQLYYPFSNYPKE